MRRTLSETGIEVGVKYCAGDDITHDGAHVTEFMEQLHKLLTVRESLLEGATHV